MYKILIAILVICMIFLSAGGTVAYLTAESTAFANDFTVGTLSVKVSEDDFDALTEDEKVIYYGRDIPKSPCVTNTGNVTAYVYLEVINRGSLLMYDVSDDWETVTETADGSDTVTVYAYCVSSVASGETTTPLFSSVTWPDIPEGTFEMGTPVNLDIRAIGIQYDNIRISGESFSERAKTVFLRYGEANG